MNWTGRHILYSPWRLVMICQHAILLSFLRGILIYYTDHKTKLSLLIPENYIKWSPTKWEVTLVLNSEEQVLTFPEHQHTSTISARLVLLGLCVLSSMDLNLLVYDFVTCILGFVAPCVYIHNIHILKSILSQYQIWQ